MTYTSASLTYRQAAMQQASTVGLVIALYDTLVGDLTRAVEATERRDIQTRCDQLAHGFKVLQQLEIMIDHANGGPTAISLQRFYRHIRNQLLQAQFKLSPDILREQINIILEVREAWQKVDGAAIERSSVHSSTHCADDSNQIVSRLSLTC